MKQTSEILQKYFNQKEIESLANFCYKKREKKIRIISISKTEIVIECENKAKYILERFQDQFREKEFQNPNNQKNPSQKLKNAKKMQTKKGRITSSNANLILAPAAIVIALSITMGFQKKQEPTYSFMPNNQIENIVEQANETPKKIQNHEVMVSIHAETPIVEEKRNAEPPISIQETFVEVIQKEDMSKRLETDTLFGASIDYYAARYGIPSAIGKALITQERPNNTQENIGQLTRNICGEKMLIPIIEKDQEDRVSEKELDKIYIVRDMPIEEEFENANNYQQALFTYQNQLKEAVELEKKGYQIFKFEDVIQNPHLCIQISMANLSHCVYKCKGNVNQGIRGYNGGYGFSATATDEEIANGLLEIGDPFYNAHVFSYLLEGELDTVLWKVKNVNNLSEEELKNAEVTTIKLQFNNVRDRTDEKENGYHF